ncbi:MAG: Appr-1-p processing protein, partial [Chloroflexi bacterium]|nr:Appr-1-p processing protein [Chloroflexota bacterium]
IPPWILNFPTKDHWRSVARLEDIVRGLRHLKGHYREWGITSLAVPPLGCGEGGLEWRVVGPTLYRHLSELEVPVDLYAPYGTPQAEIRSSFLSEAATLAGTGAGAGPPRIKPEWIALVEILARIENEPYHWPIGRTVFQKIAYFATAAGLDTGLVHSRGSFGPYSSDLKARIAQLVNNGLIREERVGSNMFAVKTGPTFADAREAYQESLKPMEATIERVADLFLRMRTKQAEVAATVRFAGASLAQESDEQPSERQVLSYVMQWKQKRRPPLDESEVAKSIRNLAALGWLSVRPSPDLPLREEISLDS